MATYNDHSEFKLRSERRMPDLFLPFSVCLQPVCFFFLMSCQGPGPPKTLWVKGGLKPQNGTGTGGLQLANDALWHTDLETAVPLDQTVIIWYLPLPCIILDVMHLVCLFVCLFCIIMPPLSSFPETPTSWCYSIFSVDLNLEVVEEVKLSKCSSVSFFISVWIEWAKKKKLVQYGLIKLAITGKVKSPLFTPTHFWTWRWLFVDETGCIISFRVCTPAPTFYLLKSMSSIYSECYLLRFKIRRSGNHGI